MTSESPLVVTLKFGGAKEAPWAVLRADNAKDMSDILVDFGASADSALIDQIVEASRASESANAKTPGTRISRAKVESAKQAEAPKGQPAKAAAKAEPKKAEPAKAEPKSNKSQVIKDALKPLFEQHKLDATVLDDLDEETLEVVGKIGAIQTTQGKTKSDLNTWLMGNKGAYAKVKASKEIQAFYKAALHSLPAKEATA